MRLPVFQPLEPFRPTPGFYQLLPFRFLRWNERETLLVNEAGEFLFLDHPKLHALIEHRLDPEVPEYGELEAKHFLAEHQLDLPVELLATKVRTKKRFLEGFTKLHLFVITLRCDHSCHYCQVSRVGAHRSRYDMTEDTARRAVELMFRSPSPALKVEFQGGEPLLNFELLRFIVEEVERRNTSERREIEFVVATNLVPLDTEILDFLHEHRILVSTSLDGPAEIHDANRPRPGGNSHAITLDRIAQVRERLGWDRVSALMTTTACSLDHPREIVDEYARLGFDAIFLRPISPYGFAVRTGAALAYETERFLDFYAAALDRIIELNRVGTPLVEVYAQILLTKMLTPFATGYVDLQSPCGAGLGGVAYNYDGDVYASDEARMLAEMGDKSFRLGNVHTDTYAQIFGGARLRALVASSVLEILPGCSDCAFLPFCGGDPIFHHRTQGDVVGHRPTSAFCTRNMGILRDLFERWRGADAFVRELFLRWATGVDPWPAQETPK